MLNDHNREAIHKACELLETTYAPYPNINEHCAITAIVRVSKYGYEADEILTELRDYLGVQEVSLWSDKSGKETVIATLKEFANVAP